jgi:hypothetical protein
MSEEKKKPETREERKARIELEKTAQKELDLERINELEIEWGDENIKVLEVNYTEGFPVLLAVRTAKPAELKKYRADMSGALKGVGGKASFDGSSANKASENLGTLTCVYPDREVLLALAEKRPAILADLGNASVELAKTSLENEGKG